MHFCLMKLQNPQIHRKRHLIFLHLNLLKITRKVAGNSSRLRWPKELSPKPELIIQEKAEKIKHYSLLESRFLYPPGIHGIMMTFGTMRTRNITGKRIIDLQPEIITGLQRESLHTAGRLYRLNHVFLLFAYLSDLYQLT